ncbi:MAG: endonuclease/exonuclease/phosphatase family protein [Acidimicrobiia bacterium]
MLALILVLLGVVVAHLVAFDREHLFMLANAYTLWIYLPAYPIAVSALLFRAWPLAVTAGLIVVAQLAWVVPPMTRTVTVTDAARSAPHVRVVSANLRFDNGNHAPLVAQLRSFHADLMVLEEVTPAWWNAIEAGGLTSSLPVVVKAVRDDPGGMAILSRYPLTHVMEEHADGWPVITATVMLGGRDLHVVGVHPVAPLEAFEGNQRAQREITAIARRIAKPRVLAGDFNSTPYNRWLEQLLDLGLRDSSDAVGQPFATTWQNGRIPLAPLLLDHVLVDAPIVPIDVREGSGEGSDHRPIVVDLAIVP